MEIVNLIFYILIFCIGSLFGSFFTLAVYRLPLHQDITHERSYCPNCNHKLSFWDMIPIFSYIFLGGKCRYCKNKIRIRYLLLEVFTGTIFLLVAMSIKFDLNNLQNDKLAYIIFIFLYIAGIIIIAGIDKEKRQINKSVLLYEFILLNIYMIYLYIVENANIHRYVIYLFVVLLLLIIDILILKNKLKNSYVINIIILSIIMVGFTYETCFICTTIITFLATAISIIISNISGKNKEYYKKINLAFYLCTSNIISLIIINMMAYGWFK